MSPPRYGKGGALERDEALPTAASASQSTSYVHSAAFPWVAHSSIVIKKGFSKNKQEDTHEFFRFVTDGLQNSALAPYPKYALTCPVVWFG